MGGEESQGPGLQSAFDRVGAASGPTLEVGTDRAELFAEVLRVGLTLGAAVTAVAGPGEAETVGGVQVLDHRWPHAADLPLRGGTRRIVIGADGEGASVLAGCQALQGSHAVELPQGHDGLVSLLAPWAPHSGSTGGLVVGVLGAVGGVGASTLTLAIAAAGARESRTVLVVDADPWGPGLSVPLGREVAEGGGWPAVDPGAVLLDASSLRASLPRCHDFWLLTGLPGPVPGVPTVLPPALPAVLACAGTGFDLAVVDLGRTNEALEAAVACDVVIIVAPATLAGVVAGRRLVAAVAHGERPPAVRLVVREGGPVPIPAVERYLDHPVVASFAPARVVGEHSDAGELLAARSGRRLLRLGRQILAGLT